MKLNYKRTILVGFAFFLICAFWQAYDNTVPLILTNKFGMSQTWSGVIMALDNVLALFLLPLFGKLSDRTHTRLGRRMPYILGGTLAAVVLMNLLPVADLLRQQSQTIRQQPLKRPCIHLRITIRLNSTQPSGNRIANRNRQRRGPFICVQLDCPGRLFAARIGRQLINSGSKHLSSP